MFRTLILFIAVALLVLVVQKLYRQQQQKKQDDAALPDAEDMVPCAYCGVHLPAKNALRKDGAFYCSKEHANS